MHLNTQTTYTKQRHEENVLRSRRCPLVDANWGYKNHHQLSTCLYSFLILDCFKCTLKYVTWVGQDQSVNPKRQNKITLKMHPIYILKSVILLSGRNRNPGIRH